MRRLVNKGGKKGMIRFLFNSLGIYWILDFYKLTSNAWTWFVLFIFVFLGVIYSWLIKLNATQKQTSIDAESIKQQAQKLYEGKNS